MYLDFDDLLQLLGFYVLVIGCVITLERIGVFDGWLDEGGSYEPLPEQYSSACCGAVFTPGNGANNIFQLHDPAAVSSAGDIQPDEVDIGGEMREVDEFLAAAYDSYRDGECPVCGAENPVMKPV